MDYRKKRLIVLLALLTASLAVLLMEPEDEILTETRWERLESTGHQPCPPVSEDLIRWTVQLDPPAHGALEDLPVWIRRAVGTTCREACVLDARIEMKIDTIAWASFFDGAGSVSARLDLVREGIKCRDRHSFGLTIKIDQGRRGSTDRQAQEMSRLIASGMRRHASLRAAHIGLK